MQWANIDLDDSDDEAVYITIQHDGLHDETVHVSHKFVFIFLHGMELKHVSHYSPVILLINIQIFPTPIQPTLTQLLTNIEEGEEVSTASNNKPEAIHSNEELDNEDTTDKLAA